MSKILLYALVAVLALIFIKAADGKAERSATASWYGPGLYGNVLGCGGRLTTGTWGVANKTIPCGTRLSVCFKSRCTNVTVVDRGPWVSGREFDLTSAVASYLRFNGVQTITWRYR